MNTFTHLKIGAKIFISFLIILILIVVTGTLALVKISQINATVTDLADNLASDQHLAGQLVIQILQVRLYANLYVRSQADSDLKGVREELVNLKELLTRATKELSIQEQSIVAKINSGIQDYTKDFEEILKLINERRKIIDEVLDVQGPLVEDKLQQLRDKTFQANEASISFEVGNSQRALLLMRLDVFKYLANGDPQWFQKFEKRYQETQEASKKIDDTIIKDSALQQLAKEVKTIIDLYHQSMLALSAAYDRQNQLLENIFYVTGPKLQADGAELSSKINAGFLNGKQEANLLVTKIWTQLLVVMSLTVFMGLIFSVVLSRNITAPLAIVMTMINQMVAGNLSQRLELQNQSQFSKLKTRRDELGDIWRSFDLLASYFKAVIEDIVQVSQGLAVGNLRFIPQAEYRGDFIQIRQSLETALSDLQQVIEDIVQVSQGLAEGQQIMTKADYRGDFVQIKTGLETAATKLAEATTRNATQDWLKTGQALLNEQLRGEQEVTTLAKNVINFLTPYVEAQVGVFYLLETVKEGTSESTHLKLIASYAYTQRKGLPMEFTLGEGLIGQAALEQQFILVTEVPEDYIHIESGLGEAVPQNILVMPFLYENAVKGVIELGSFQVMNEIKLEFLKQIMPSIGIVVNTAESRSKMQMLLQKIR